MKLLHIDSSVLADNSVSRKLTARIAKEWQAARPGTQVQYLDLATAEPAHLSGEALGARFVPAESHTELQKRETAYTEDLLQQFLGADVIVVGAPMYNFSIPSQLKAWIDRIAVAGRTFKYGENGPVGLAGGKTVVVVSTRGGVYSTSEAMRALDHQESYLTTVFGFLGITDVRFVRAEGTSMGDAKKAEAVAGAEAEIAALTA
ncbi:MULTISPECIES: FMN-dependent NADH-azoreductase [Silvimonas]|jgi:FMN-dependent NADH-azoreductase|uniref:FMN-dependent NADH-azoreductase n=1 Tax=Silvimonas TaxID=300264 RepID=UPI0024B336E4|nr:MULTISPECIES: FMN-dependent NADH-azoreductase [Silvimonas]MDR3430106.1 FMN-dependent NADH-azoreductase [Silvimonas sp.]